MNMTVDQIAPNWGGFKRLFWIVAALLAALLALMWLFGYGPGGSACKVPMVASAPAVVTPPVVAAPAPAPVVAAAPATPAPATAAPPAAKVYFGLDKSELPGDVQTTLAAVVTFLKANDSAKASISGFHDPSGNQAHNEELALNRARAVRDALAQAGIPKERVAMQKPMQTTGSGAPEEARRVEVSVVQ